jgi:DNA-binding NtrC family response regulator
MCSCSVRWQQQASTSCERCVFHERPHDLDGLCVIADAIRLSRDQQAALSARLQTGGRLRVITLSRAPLYPLVLVGTFDATLYYRLNMITLEYAAE